jgi:hypothetical protein
MSMGMPRLRHAWLASILSLAFVGIPAPRLAYAQDDEAARLRKEAEELKKKAAEAQRRADEARRKADREKREAAKQKREAERKQRAEDRKRREEAKKKPAAPTSAPPLEAAPAAAEAPPAEAVPAPPTAPVQPVTVAPPVATGPPKALEKIGDARWSASLGFVESAKDAPSVIGPEAKSTAASTSPAPRQQLTLDPKSIEGASSNLGYFVFGYAALTLDPVTEDDRSILSEMSGHEGFIGAKFVFGDHGVGGWVAPTFRVLSAKNDDDQSIFTFTPVNVDGGVDFYLTRGLSIGPRLGGFAHPLHMFKSDADAEGENGFYGGVEYGALARFRLEVFYIEASIYYRNTFSLVGQYAGLEAGVKLGAVYLVAGIDARMGVSGEPDFTGEKPGEIIAQSMPEKQRLVAGVGINLF